MNNTMTNSHAYMDRTVQFVDLGDEQTTVINGLQLVLNGSVLTPQEKILVLRYLMERYRLDLPVDQQV